MGNRPVNDFIIRDLDFSYKSKKSEIRVISKLDMEINQGELLAILGPSGCGKTTFLRLAAGFLKPDSGSITYRNQTVDAPFPSGQMIFQDFSQLFPWLSIEKNIMFPKVRPIPLIGSPPTRKEKQRCQTLLEQTGLAGQRNKHPHQLSGGMKQRAALARALFAEPEILFMDEAFGSLDAPARIELQELLLTLQKTEKKTIFFVTHTISEALYLADDLLIFPGNGQKPYKTPNPLPHPRSRSSQKFQEEKIKLYNQLTP